MAIYFAASSLDGFIADADDGIEWLHALPQPNPSHYEGFLEGIGAIAMGRATYEFLLRHMAEGNPWPYSQPTWVFTNQKFAPQDGVIFAKGDVKKYHSEMQKFGEIWIVGGGELAGQFYDAGYLDELHITVASVTLGSGRPVFPREAKLKLIKVTPMGDGFVELRFVPIPE